MKVYRQGHWSIVIQKRQVFDVMGKKKKLKKPIAFPVLRHLDKIVMSNTPQESMMMRREAQKAKGNALVAGLGLGIILRFLRPKCDTITVVEKNEDVIKLYRKYAGERPMCDKIIHDSIEGHLGGNGLSRYDYVHLDTWYDLHAELLPHVNYLIKLARTRLNTRGIIRAWGLDWMRKKYVKDTMDLWKKSRTRLIRAKERNMRRLTIAYPLLGKFVEWFRRNPGASEKDVRAEVIYLSKLAEKSKYPLEYADDINKMLASQEDPLWQQLRSLSTQLVPSVTVPSTSSG